MKLLPPSSSRVVHCAGDHILLRAVALLAIMLPAAKASLAEELVITSRPWPEADQLFRRDSRWRGSDAANSVDLGDGRVLWTFGDSFVDKTADPERRSRRSARFIRNSVAIQRGYDPTSAEFVPYWQEAADGTPASFLRPEGDVFCWPGGGLMLEGKLLIFLMRVRNSDQPMGFSVDGWGVVLVDNPQDRPCDWTMHFVDTPQNSLGVMVGSGSSLRVGQWVYSFGSDLSRDHRLFLTRILVSDALAADVSRLQWWCGSKVQWVDQASIDQQLPQPVVKQGQTEFTVHYQSDLQSYLLTQFEYFPRSPIAIRSAPDLSGPWSSLASAFIPEEVNNPAKDVIIYAAKAHPEQHSEGLAVTYCTNTTALATVRLDETLYYPRFARCTIRFQEADIAK